MQPLEPEDPRQLGEYRLLRRLGAGGMGRVYLARSGTGRTVAVKVVHPHHAVDEEFRRRFRREVEWARRVGGAWTAPVLDAGTEGPVPWVATGYVAGPSLTRAVAEHGPLPEATVRALGAGLAEALAHVHGLGLVHRDVKPSNVLLTPDGIRLIDFGIARAVAGAASLTSTGVSVGSPGYMAPEQILGRGATAASDVFALGAVLVFAGTGENPFPGDTSAALLYHVVHGEARLDGLPEALRGTAARTLGKDPAERPAPDALAAELAGSAGGAGELLRSGWLPAPLVEQLGRRAAELLELEPQVSQASGPVPFTTPAYGPGAADGRPAPLLPHAPLPPPDAVPPGFGPPDPSYGKPAGGLAAAAGPAAVPPPADGPGPEQYGRRSRIVLGTGPPADGPGGAAAGGGAAEAEGGPRRRVSCTLVVTLACVVAAALLGTGYVAGLLPGLRDSGHDNTAEPPPAATKPPGKGTKEPPDGGGSGGGPDGAGAGVPEEFVGTWRGDLTSRKGVPLGTLTVTVKEGDPGDTVATGSSKLVGTECAGRWKLVSATDDRLVVDASGTEPGSKLCARGGSAEEFRLGEDHRLRYASHEESSGYAVGTLRKIG
ncbi:serine/threonine-protein kinase [Streptomyces sp. AA1529]|uniref:serine/threonine-protein kinase n=1 Tax=Streptomyces sp. AA1529 TaxID=1203257 RepID=UPI00031A2DEE|nr:serine/threonine-protein kinase [Streptomyces sp. AA1529]